MYNVHFVIDAEQDLFDIYRYFTMTVSRKHAEGLLKELEEVCLGLENLPRRGHVPPELQFLGVREYQEIHCRTYRRETRTCVFRT